MKTIRPVLLLAALPAALLTLAPAVHGTLLYDRTAILHGEWWRLWTGHWVHFSTSHLAWNLAALLGAGAWLEGRQPGWLARFLLLAAPVLSLALLVGEPAMLTYGGLSGLATGVVVLLALDQAGRNRAARGWWISLLVLVGLKLVFEATHPAPLFSRFGTQAVRTSGLAHAAGALVAIMYFVSPLARRRAARSKAILPGGSSQAASPHAL